MNYNKNIIKNVIVYLGNLYGGHLVLYKNTLRLTVEDCTFLIYRNKEKKFVFNLLEKKKSFIDSDLLRGLYRAWSYPINRTIKYIPTDEDWNKILSDAISKKKG